MEQFKKFVDDWGIQNVIAIFIVAIALIFCIAFCICNNAKKSNTDNVEKNVKQETQTTKKKTVKNNTNTSKTQQNKNVAPSNKQNIQKTYKNTTTQQPAVKSEYPKQTNDIEKKEITKKAQTPKPTPKPKSVAKPKMDADNTMDWFNE